MEADTLHPLETESSRLGKGNTRDEHLGTKEATKTRICQLLSNAEDKRTSSGLQPSNSLCSRVDLPINK